MTDTHIIEQEARNIAPVAAPQVPMVDNPQIMDLVAHAVQHGQMEMVTQLLDIRNSEEARAAEKSFNAAYSKMQAEMPIIPKRGTGHNNITYARIEDIMQAVMPVLASHGLSLRHKTDNGEGKIQVTAVLAHVDGHSETDTMFSNPDKSGGKSDIHAIKSAITYMRRTTAENILGLASHGEDDDAFSTSEADFDTSPFTEAIRAAKSMDTLNKVAADMKALDVPSGALTMLRTAWAGRAAQIQKELKDAA